VYTGIKTYFNHSEVLTMISNNPNRPPEEQADGKEDNWAIFLQDNMSDGASLYNVDTVPDDHEFVENFFRTLWLG